MPVPAVMESAGAWSSGWEPVLAARQLPEAALIRQLSLRLEEWLPLPLPRARRRRWRPAAPMQANLVQTRRDNWDRRSSGLQTPPTSPSGVCKTDS